MNIEIEEIEIQYISKATHAVDSKSIVENFIITKLIEKSHNLFSAFWRYATKNKTSDKIKHLLYYGSSDGKIEARAKLRLLGVKTRSYREHGSVFGLYDDDQLISAKMTMNSVDSIDIEALRQKIQ